MFKTMQRLLGTTKFAGSLTSKVCLLLAIQTLPNLISKLPIFLLVDFEQVFYEFFFLLENLCLAFLQYWQYCSILLFYESNLQLGISPKTYVGQQLFQKIAHIKLTCSSYFGNVGGCQSQILMVLGYIREHYMKSLIRTILEKSVF